MERKLSPRLYETYLTLLSARRQRVLTADEFSSAKNRLLEQQAKVERARVAAARRREMKAAKKEQERLALREREERRKAEERKKKAYQKRNKAIFNEIVGDPYATLSDLRKAIGDRMEARIVTDTMDFTVLGGLKSNDFIDYFRAPDYPNLKIQPGERVLAFAPSRIKAQKIRQMFLDGIVHCVFTPLLNRLDAKLSVSKGKAQVKRLKQRRNLMLSLQDEYKTGVPEEQMETIAKQSGFKITMFDRLNQAFNIYNKSGKEGSISLTNSRENHLDEGVLVNNEKKPISLEEMRLKWKFVKENKGNVLATIQNGMVNGVPRELHLLNEGFKIYDPEDDIYASMNEVVKNYGFDAIKHPDVNEFLRASRIINSAPCLINDIEAEHHLDMPAAYTQFKKCKYYMGFPGVIHQWRSGDFNREFISQHIGSYRVRVLKGTKMSSVFGLSGIHVLCSPEILSYMDRGVEFEITHGAWGSRFDFEFPPEMLEKKRYAIWTGKLGCEYPNDTFTFTGSKKWAEHLAFEHGENNVCYYDDSGMIRVNVPKKSLITRHHIFAFITAYLRIQMMDAIDVIGIDNVQKVVMDGIYFRGSIPASLSWFKEKPFAEHKYYLPWYEEQEGKWNWSKNWLDDNCVLTGQGGAGKTYLVMNDEGFNNILYVVTQHVLGQKKKEEYGVNYTTAHKLIGLGCVPYRDEYITPPVLLLDELTQWESEWVDKAIAMYPESLIIIAGDIKKKGDKVMWFQCRNGTPSIGFSKIWNPTIEMVEVKGDRRSLDDSLKQLKLDIRKVMEDCFVDGDSGEDFAIRSWAQKNLKPISFEKACGMFQEGDIWIAGTHKTHEALLARGIMSGWLKKGGYIEFERDWNEEGYVKRGSFTTHAFQGQTVETGKVFISVFDTFEYSMLYTAIARARHFDQLVFVGH